MLTDRQAEPNRRGGRIDNNALDDQNVRWLNEFADLLCSVNVRVADLGLRNITSGEAISRFLVVDGSGVKARIPRRA